MPLPPWRFTGPLRRSLHSRSGILVQGRRANVGGLQTGSAAAQNFIQLGPGLIAALDDTHELLGSVAAISAFAEQLQQRLAPHDRTVERERCWLEAKLRENPPGLSELLQFLLVRGLWRLTIQPIVE